MYLKYKKIVLFANNLIDRFIIKLLLLFKSSMKFKDILLIFILNYLLIFIFGVSFKSIELSIKFYRHLKLIKLTKSITSILQLIWDETEVSIDDTCFFFLIKKYKLSRI